MNDEYYMREALELAREAAAFGEVPVGAVVADGNGTVVGRGRNCRENGRNALKHAEISAIDMACGTLGGWRLADCTLYVTLEPCMMCSGAILSARIKRVVFAARDRTSGGKTSLTALADAGLPLDAEITEGVLREESERLIEEFFCLLRRKRKMSKINIVEVKTEAQTEAAAALACEIWHEWFPPIIGMEQTDYMVQKFQSAEAMTEQMRTEGYRYYLLLRSGTRIGYTAIRPDADGRLFLSKLYIKKEYRGNGYSKEVFAFLKSFCRENGLKAVWLTVNKNNSNSIAVYEKCGFVKIGSGVTDIGNGFVMDDYYYQLDAEEE